MAERLPDVEAGVAALAAPPAPRVRAEFVEVLLAARRIAPERERPAPPTVAERYRAWHDDFLMRLSWEERGIVARLLDEEIARREAERPSEP